MNALVSVQAGQSLRRCNPDLRGLKARGHLAILVNQQQTETTQRKHYA